MQVFRRSFLPCLPTIFLLVLATLIWTAAASAQNCFVSGTSILDGQHPISVATADFNLDGHLDVVAANPPLQGVSVLLGNGNGTFQTPEKISVGFQPWYVITGDLNLDGKPDIVMADYTYCVPSFIYVLLGNGDGTFQPAMSFAVDKTPISLSLADFNHDGIPDLVAVNSCSADVSVLIGTGNGGFLRAVNYPVESALSVVTSDFNEDGNMDMAVIAGGGNLSLFEGRGDGTFNPVITTNVESTADLPNTVTTADLNHDGHADLVVSNIFGGLFNMGTVAVILGNGDGSFQSATTYSSLANSEAATIADVNGDGILDFTVATTNSAGINSFLGNGDGTFRFAGQYVSGDGSTSLAAGDFNEDGRADLIVANNGLGITANSNVSPGNLSLLIGNGDGTFQSGRNSVGVRQPEGLVAADFNHDGKLDLAVAGSSGGLKVLSGVGDGTFGIGYSYQGGVSLNEMAAGDFNHDGSVDVAVTSSETKGLLVFLGNGDGTLQSPVQYFANATPRAIAAADLNEDGFVDLIVTNDMKGRQGTVSVLLGQAGGSFGSPQTYAVDGRPKAVAVGDFNRDGKLDLAVANFVSGNVSVLLGNGDGTFGAANNYMTGPDPRSVAVGDFNHDDIPDLAVADFGTSMIAVLLGNGDGSFGAAVPYHAGHGPGYVGTADINGDGKLDLVVSVSYTGAHGNGSVGVLLGNGDGSFQQPTYYGTGLLPRPLAIADFNGDGMLDVASGNFVGNDVTVLLNSAGGKPARH